MTNHLAMSSGGYLPGSYLWFLLLVPLLFCIGCSTVGKPMRFDPKTHAKKEAWYIEGQDKNGRPYSCSFVEFDGRGDYIDFRQHTNAWEQVKQLAEKQKILLVFYCHGWKNNSQSGDVVEFNSFLGRLSASPSVGEHGYRVHGVYLGWRGNVYRPYVNKNDEEGFYQQTTNDFREPIVSEAFQRSCQASGWLQENLSYWGRRNAAETKVSGVPIARTIYTCASLVKTLDKERHRERLLDSSRVMVMGHSFGALLLERALSPTCIDPLTDQWTWFGRGTGARTTANPLPLDFVLFVNSAAPSIYSKVMRDFLAAHHSALVRAQSPYTNTPVFVSLTSSADSATGRLHPYANVLSPLAPSLQRSYTNLFEGSNRAVHQSEFYKRTPGHNPLLVDHWIVREDKKEAAARTREEIFNLNLDYQTPQPLEFLAVPAGEREAKPQVWKLSESPPPKEEKWARQLGGLVPRRFPSAFWIVRCDERLIRSHNDVWTNTAMELYAALYRFVEASRLEAATRADKSGTR